VETIPIIRNELESISSKGALFVTELQKANIPVIKEIRQYGLMIAIDLDISESKFKNLVQKAIDYEILILTTGIATTIRLLPPLNISENEIQLAVSRISNLLKST
jgi:acetylornithine aminotransferase